MWQNPSTTSGLGFFFWILRETGRECQPVQVFCSYLLQMFQSRKTILPWIMPFSFFLLQRYISMICLLPSVLVKQNWCFPILQLEGWHSTAAELVQRKSVIEPPVQALSWDGAEADFQFYPQIHNRCKHFTLDQCLIKSSHRRGGWEESKLKVSLSIPVYHLLPCKGSNCKGL